MSIRNDYILHAKRLKDKATAMTTAQRTAITPSAGQLIFDTDLGALFVGDGATAGGKAVGGGGGGGTATAMTTAQRTAITPSAGQLIYDTDLGALFVGDGSTAGGKEIEGGGGGGGTPATVTDIMTGSGASNILNVTNIRGALTAGQAVDVTSKPDSYVGENWRGVFTWDQASLGFALFPKYAPGLTYLLIADMAIMSDFGTGVSGTVTPAGTWLDGSRTTRTILDTDTGYTRIAMLFSTSSSCKLNFTYAGTGAHWDVRNLREYEVTSLTAEAIAYIAALDSPDAFADYYLVKQDMVQPWTYIIDMGSSPAVTIASGLSYKLNATGTHQLTVDSCPAGYDGRDAIIRIRLSGNGVIQAVAPLQLGGALVPYAINNCVVRFRDGEAVLLVEDTLAGYVVTLTSGTGEGSLPYGLASTGVPYIGFSSLTDGIPVDLSGATTAAEEVVVVGNGFEDTILTGSITCTSKTFMANLALSDVGIKGGTMTLGDVFIPSGSTVAVSGGGLAIEKVTGDGETSVIDLGLTNINVSSDATLSGCTISGGRATNGGAMLVSKGKSADVTSCVFAGNSATGSGGAIYNNSGTVDLTGCTFTGNYSPAYGLAVLNNAGVVYLNGCAFGAGQSVTNTGASAVTIVSGSCATAGTLNKQGSYGTLLISAGAIIDATGNTNNTIVIQSAGGCKVGSGTPDNWVVNGTAKFINSAGAEIDLSGTFTSITKAGVVS